MSEQPSGRLTKEEWGYSSREERERGYKRPYGDWLERPLNQHCSGDPDLRFGENEEES
jgi:hypothetical protein